MTRSQPEQRRFFFWTVRLRIEERLCDEERFYQPRLKDRVAVAVDRPVTAFMRHPVTELREATRTPWKRRRARVLDVLTNPGFV